MRDILIVPSSVVFLLPSVSGNVIVPVRWCPPGAFPSDAISDMASLRSHERSTTKVYVVSKGDCKQVGLPFWYVGEKVSGRHW